MALSLFFGASYRNRPTRLAPSPKFLLSRRKASRELTVPMGAPVWQLVTVTLTLQDASSPFLVSRKILAVRRFGAGDFELKD
jgi:hypothetical protein